MTIPSPITIASFGSRPTACAACSMSSGSGLPMTTGVMGGLRRRLYECYDRDEALTAPLVAFHSVV